MSTLLENMPDINFAQKDTEQIAAEVIARFEKEAGRTLFPGDPWRQALLTIVYFLSMQRSKIDFTGKQNLLAFSDNDFIEHIGALVLGDNPRLQPRPAITTLEFTLSQAKPSNTIIPAGTRATAGSNLFFATTEDVEIPAGELRVQAPAECNQVGEIGNGWLPGQINRIVDSFPFNYSVQNVTISQGGANKEELEPFRERIRMAPESYSTAGPYGAYEF
ncbi:MAG: baseplate J/gp47 family protein, partial [Oscillospiraceae bacterium]|nr:baseplate J/gp47 family protein [Oscillospiraceae bacterium]